MGKKKNQILIQITEPAHIPISKSHNFKKNMQNFFRIMKKNFSSIKSREYLKYLHEHVRKCKKVLKSFDQKTLITCVNKKIRICKICQKWSNDSNIIVCQLCEDYFHKKCHGKFQDGLCQECYSISEKLIKKQQEAQRHIDKTKQCQKCLEQRKNKKRDGRSPRKSSSKSPSKRQRQSQFINHVSNSKLNQCIKCDKYYHQECFGKFGVNIVCYKCKKQIQNQVKDKLKQKQILRQSTLHEFSSRKKNKLQSSPSKIKQQVKEQTKKYPTNLLKDQQSTKFTLISKRHFIQEFPSMTEEQIKKYKTSLLQAIYTKKMEYTEELKFIDCEIEDDDDENSLDFSLSMLNKKDQEMFKKYKDQPIGPFILQYKKNMGYDVIADKSIPKGMIVCEYIGDVVTLRKALESEDNDSRFQLKSGPNSNSTLLIRPEKYTNIARFINGINNKTGRSKQNVQSIRISYRGRPAVILYTIRKIQKGESLLYDYNSGQSGVGYDTTHYV